MVSSQKDLIIIYPDEWMTKFPQLSSLSLYSSFTFCSNAKLKHMLRIHEGSLIRAEWGGDTHRGYYEYSPLFLKCLILRWNLKCLEFLYKLRESITQWGHHREFYFQNVMQALFSTNRSSKWHNQEARGLQSTPTQCTFMVFKNYLSSISRVNNATSPPTPSKYWLDMQTQKVEVP